MPLLILLSLVTAGQRINMKSDKFLVRKLIQYFIIKNLHISSKKIFIHELNNGFQQILLKNIGLNGSCLIKF